MNLIALPGSRTNSGELRTPHYYKPVLFQAKKLSPEMILFDLYPVGKRVSGVHIEIHSNLEAAHDL